jgi:HAE1 family hydrophobic/amphiphilic exporter-1
LVVFIPLAFTSNLSNAILGDLAKAVVFSHAFSAIVALILVPTVRLHIMSRESTINHPVSPVEKQLNWLETKYSDLLARFLSAVKVKRLVFFAVPAVLAMLIWFVLPRLPKEIVGVPDTDWVFISVKTDGQTKRRQMEMLTDQVERDVMKKFGERIDYTFYQVWSPNGGFLMLRLKDKSLMGQTVKELESAFPNNATTKFWTGPYNPSEMPLPDPPHLQIAVTGSDPVKRMQAASEISELLESKQTFPRIQTKPEASRSSVLQIWPKTDQIKLARASGYDISFDEVMQQFRVLLNGRGVGTYPFGIENYAINLTVAGTQPASPEDVGSYSVAVGSKIVPLRALADIKLAPTPPDIKVINDREVNLILGRLPELSKSEAGQRREQAKKHVDEWQASYNARHAGESGLPKVEFEDGEKEITEAIHQLALAIGWSVVLIFITMLIQFGSIVEPLIVLAAVPLGMIGVLVSLFVFRSSLSLNSALGVILLNGIAVANSIILVDFAKKLADEGMEPTKAVLSAARARLRPILITSLTTVLGMLPIAFGFGEGGKILQPLGIAVSGGLWVSMLLTLFAVPALHLIYLKKIAGKRGDDHV